MLSGVLLMLVQMSVMNCLLVPSILCILHHHVSFLDVKIHHHHRRHHLLLRLPHVCFHRKSTPAPVANLHAVLVHVLPDRAYCRVSAWSCLAQIRTPRPPVRRRRQDVPRPVLQSGATGLAAGRPRREPRNHAVQGAGHQTRLLGWRAWPEELADPLGHGRTVGRPDAPHRAALDAVLGGDAPGPGRVASTPEVVRGHTEGAGAPFRDVPLKQVLVPLTHFEAGSLGLGTGEVQAVDVMRVPAVRVDAPHTAGLDAAGATLVPLTPTPRTCGDTNKQ